MVQVSSVHSFSQGFLLAGSHESNAFCQGLLQTVDSFFAKKLQMNYSSGLEVRILKNLGSTDRILKAKIREL